MKKNITKKKAKDTSNLPIPKDCRNFDLQSEIGGTLVIKNNTFCISLDLHYL